MSLKNALKKTSRPPTLPANNLIVMARAGTGKTTTMIEGLKLFYGSLPSIVPSEQQRAIWDELVKYGKPQSIGFVAFNVSIAEELKKRVSAGVTACTSHSLGFKAVRQTFGDLQVDGNRCQSILQEILQLPINAIHHKYPSLVPMCKRIVELIKLNCVETDPESICRLAEHYDIDLAPYAQLLFEIVPVIIASSKQVEKDKRVDFCDMIWLPHALNLPIPKYDLLIVDEAQDLGRCQQSLVAKAGNRLILVGDDKQAIYGFAGADSASLSNMSQELNASVLPLTVTRRCGKAIVNEARKIVPDFEAHESNGEGSVVQIAEDALAKSDVGEGDMILCRTNAPLVQHCFRLIREGKRANIVGRDVATGLISLVRKLHAQNVAELIAKLGTWLDTEMAKENSKPSPSDARLIALQDRHDCLLCFAENLSADDDPEKVEEKINTIFDDKSKVGIRLSSIHRAKGLEAKRVFFIRTERAPCPHPMAKSSWEKEQELNLLYVGITRAIDQLVYVT